jgi:hypothetical protein
LATSNKSLFHLFLGSLKWIAFILAGLLIFRLWDFYLLYRDQLLLLTWQLPGAFGLSNKPKIPNM